MFIRMNLGENIIYVSGYYNPAGDTLACYWKNGIRHHLETVSSKANSIFYDISNGKLYVSGFKDATLRGACYWENGNFNDISNLFNDPYFGASESTSIYIANGSIYNAGYAITRPSGADEYFAGYLINRSTFSVNDGNKLNSILVYKDDVYLTGIYNSVTDPRACYWKDNERYTLDSGSYSIAYGICIGNRY